MFYIMFTFPSDFQYGSDFDVTPEMKQSFDVNGFVIIRYQKTTF